MNTPATDAITPQPTVYRPYWLRYRFRTSGIEQIQYFTSDTARRAWTVAMRLYIEPLAQGKDAAE